MHCLRLQLPNPIPISDLSKPPYHQLVEAVVQLMRADLQQIEQPLDKGGKAQQLAAAARLLRADYAEDSELTSFTALDSEDFHEEG